MAVVAVPRPLQERLGDAASASLMEVLRELEGDQEERREAQNAHLLQILEERFLRHVAESEQRIRKDLGAETADLRKEIGSVRTDVGREIADVRKEIGDVRKEIGDVRKEITTLTRWILTVAVAVTVLLPVMQRLAAALFPVQ